MATIKRKFPLFDKATVYHEGNIVSMPNGIAYIMHNGQFVYFNSLPVVTDFKKRIDILEKAFDQIVKDLREKPMKHAEYAEVENYLWTLTDAMKREAEQL